jgi:hypothetical protein
MHVIGQLHPSLSHGQYLFRRRYFSYVGAFDIYGNQMNLVLHSTQKHFDVGGDFHVYSDKKKEEEVLTIVTPKTMRDGVKYTVIDGITAESVGIIEHRAYSYILKERWNFSSRQGSKIGSLLEIGKTNAFLQRVFNFVPQNYLIISKDDREIAKVTKHFHPYVLKYTLRISEVNPSIDIRLLISSVILLGTEGKFLVPY